MLKRCQMLTDPSNKLSKNYKRERVEFVKNDAVFESLKQV